MSFTQREARSLIRKAVNRVPEDKTVLDTLPKDTSFAQRRYTGKARKFDTYQAILQADGSTPFATIASLMSAMRCTLPEFNKPPVSCYLPDESDKMKKAKDAVDPERKFYDTDRAVYDPTKMALFHDILFSTGFE